MNFCFCTPSPPCADCNGESCRAPKDQLAAASRACHSSGAALWGYSSPSTLAWSLGPAKCLPWAHEKRSKRNGLLLQGHGASPRRCTEGLVRAAIINKASKAPEGESLKLLQKTPMHIHNAPIIHEETISPPQHLPGLLFARVLPGCSAKAFPSDPAEPLAPALCWEKCRHRTSQTSSYPGTGSAGAAPVLLSKPFSGAREQKRGERLSSCRDGFLWLRRGRSARRGAGCSPCRSHQPVHGVREPGEPQCRCSAGSGVMGFLANPSPKPPQGPEQALASTPWKGRALHPLVR